MSRDNPTNGLTSAGTTHDALTIAKDLALEAFDHVETYDDQLLADARLAQIESAIAAAGGDRS